MNQSNTLKESTAFGDYLTGQELQGQDEARRGLPFSGRTWHGWYAYENEREKIADRLTTQ